MKPRGIFNIPAKVKHPRLGVLNISEDHKSKLIKHEGELYIKPQGAASSSALANGASESMLDFHIYKTPGRKCHGLVFQFDISESGGSNSVNVVFPTSFVNRIEYRTGGNKLIWTAHAYNLFKNYAILSAEQMENLQMITGITPKWTRAPCLTIPPGEKRRLFLFIFGDPFTSSPDGIPMMWADFLNIRLFLQDSVESGSGTLSLDDLNLRIMTEEIPVEEQQLIIKEFSMASHKYRYLDYQAVTTETKTISSTEVKIKLQNFNGYNACTDIVLRSSVAPDNGAYRNFVSLGRAAEVEYEDRNSRSLTGGNPFDPYLERYFKASTHLDGNFYFYNAVTPLIFSHLGEAMKGKMEGAMLEDSYNQVVIKASPDSRNEPVLTVTPSGTGASGFYAIRFTDPVSGKTSVTRELAYNATASTIKSALEALPNWHDSNLNTVTVSGALTSAATFTFDGPHYANDFAHNISANTLSVVSISVLTSGSSPVSFTTTYTTEGNNGFDSTSLRVDLYSHMFRCMIILPNGAIEVEDDRY